MRLTRLFPCLIALAAASQEPEFRLKVDTRLVVVNVEVKDRDGKPVEGLARQDFRIFEDGKPQKVAVFEFQRLEPETPAPAPATPAAEPAAAVTRRPQISASKPGQVRYQDRRLMVLFFDLSSMAAEEQIRAQQAARSFIQTKMNPQDLVAVMTFSNQLNVLQDFTEDRTVLESVIRSVRVGEGSELAAEGATGSENAEDTGAAYTSDDTEFNVFNTDRKLSALESAAKMLSTLPEKKALVYFSSGVGKTGVENQSQLRATVNAAVMSNVAFYPVDARGLVAEAPLGNASSGGTQGTSMYSGSAQRERRESFESQQETLYTLAADTGGKALLDTNDLSVGIVQAQEDISSYYILGYYSTNPAEDGRYRRIRVELPENRRAKLDYRAGYFASKTFEKFNEEDKERQLEEALALGDPITDVPLALEINAFRRGNDRYIVPVAVKLPLSALSFAKKKDAEQTSLDFIAQVRNERGALVSTVRDQIEVKLGAQARTGNKARLQYDSAFTLPPGKYTLKFLVRENGAGQMGTFETRFTVSDVREERSYLRLSSVVWANQREPLTEAVGKAGSDRKLLKGHPLVRDNAKIIPSITRVFRQDQKLIVYFEAYDAAAATGGPDLAAKVAFYRGNRKAFESEAYQLPAKNGRTDLVPVEFEVPLSELNAGSYTCQLSVVDASGRKFAFRRVPVVLLPAEQPAAPRS